MLGNVRLPPSQQTACCVFKIDQEWIIRVVIGKSHGTDWVGACVCVRVRGRGGKRIGEYRPLLEPVRSQKKVMVSY